MKKPNWSDWKRKLREYVETISKGITERSAGSYGEKASAILKVTGERTKEILRKNGLGFYGKAGTILISTYFLSDLSGLVINAFIPEPKFVHSTYQAGQSGKSKRQSIDAYEIIFSRNLFNSRGLIPGEDEGNTDSITGIARKTSLPLRLIGTLVLKDKAYSIATLQDQSANRVYPVRKGDEIPNKIKVERVEARKVIFINLKNRRREYAALPEDISISEPVITSVQSSNTQGIEKLNSKRFTIQRSEIEKNLSNLNKILTQARAIPHFENGAPAGYKLFQIVPGSIYDKLGLRNGDIIRGVNGESISNPQKAFEMLNDFKNLNAVELQIKRDGTVSNMVYDIQ